MSKGFTIKEMTVGMRIFTIVIALLLILAGIITLNAPAAFVFYLVPIVIFVYGANSIVRYFLMKDMREGWDIVIGVISVVFAVLVMFYPGSEFFGLMLTELFLAFWAMFAGITKIAGSFSPEKKGTGGKALNIIVGILIIIFALLLVIYPIVGTLSILFTSGILVGLSFIFLGIAGLVTALSGKGFLNKAAEAVEAAEAVVAGDAEAAAKVAEPAVTAEAEAEA